MAFLVCLIGLPSVSQCLFSPIRAQASASNQSQDINQIVPLAAVEREMKGGETHTYRINLKSKHFLYALVEQKGIDVAVVLTSPKGETNYRADSPNDQWGPEPILLVADYEGEYRVQVTSPNSKAPVGRYAIKIIASRPATTTDDQHALAEKLFQEARKLRAQGTAASQTSAITKYNEAEALFGSVGDSYRQALTLLSIGVSYARLNDFRTALAPFEKARLLARNSGERKLEAATETFLGGMHDVLGNIKDALDHYQQAVTIAVESQHRSAEANALNNIGKIYNDMADWQKAQEYYRKALAVHRTLGNQVSEGRALQNIGVSYQMLGEPQQALDYLQQALVINRTAGEKNLTAEVLTLVGSAFYDAGETQKAFEHYNQALALTRELGNRGLEANTLDRMGVAYSSLGDATKALDRHLKALEIRRATNDRRRQAIALNNLGHVYNQLGQPAVAIKHYTEALIILRDIGDLNNVALALLGSARSEELLGNLRDASNHIAESLTLIETVRARTGSQQLRAAYLGSMEKAYNSQIRVLMQLHRLDPSGGHDAEALRTSERGRARSLMELLHESRVDIRQGVSTDLIAKERELKEQLNAKAQRLIQLKAQRGSEQEISTIDRELAQLEEEYRLTQLEIRRKSPQYAALTQPQPLGLQEIQQQLDQDTVLLEYSLGDERSYVWVVTPTSLKSFELKPRLQIEKSARQVYELLTTRSILKPNESSGARRKRLADADAKLLEASAELSTLIIKPVVPEFGKKRLVIVGDGALQYVPFAALTIPQASGGQSTRVEYRPLIIDHEIINLPSASALAVQRETLRGRKLAPNAVAVIADPVFSVTDERLKGVQAAAGGKPSQSEVSYTTRIIEHLADDDGKLKIRRLTFTRAEAESILAVAPKVGSFKATDFQANRATATSGKLSTYRYIHFATHGYLDSDRPDLSAVLLSLVDEKGEPQDGFLRAHEVYNLDLPAELVVLSACQTGLGKEIKGEGLVGLTRGFMYAGARRVLVSLWNVNDKATAELMQRFYRRMLRDNQSPAAALRLAQVEMWQQKQWQSPYYWAAFTMQGEWK